MDHRLHGTSCRSELLRFGIEARAEAPCVKMHEADKSVTELSVMHQEACKPLRVLQKLEPKVAIIMEKWRAKDNETCDDDDLDFTYLAQLILDGHKITESTK